MDSSSDIKLSVTNDLHFQKKNMCGTQFAYNKNTKTMSMFNAQPIQCPKNVLDYLATRQRIVASNVANISTPGYKTRDVSFNAVIESKNNDMRLKLKTTNERHITEPFEGNDYVDTFYAYAPTNVRDGVNDVDTDKEMLKLGEVQASFTVFSEILKQRYNGISKAIDGTP